MANNLYNSYALIGGAWENNDYYKCVNSKWGKQSAYAMQGGKWVKVVAKPSETESEPEPEPIAYLYNGVQLPPLPEWDKETYPYAYITQNPVTNGTGGFDYLLTITTDAVYLYTDDDGYAISNCDGDYIQYDYNRGEGVGWIDATLDWGIDTVRDEGGKLNTIWSNTDMTNPDGTLYLEASEPVPTNQTGWWTTSYEGELTTEATGSTNGARKALLVSLTEGKTYKVTVNGESTEVVAEKDSTCTYFGNAWLAQSDDSTYADNGYDYCKYGTLPTYFYSRNAGTYTVKIEQWSKYEL